MRSTASLLLLALTAVLPGGAVLANDKAIEAAALQRDASAGTGFNDAPRLVRTDSPTDAQPALAGQRNGSSELAYRWWLTRGRADVGIGLGGFAYEARPVAGSAGPASSGSSSVLASGTVLTLGMRYRTSDRSAIYADASGLRGPGLARGDGLFGKVGIEFKGAQSRLGLSYGGLGLRLAGDTGMTVRVRRGGVALFMRRSF